MRVWCGSMEGWRIATREERGVDIREVFGSPFALSPSFMSRKRMRPITPKQRGDPRRPLAGSRFAGWVPGIFSGSPPAGSDHGPGQRDGPLRQRAAPEAEDHLDDAVGGGRERAGYLDVQGVILDHSRTPWEGDCHGTLVIGLCTGKQYTEVPWQPNVPRVEVTAEREEDGSYTVRATAESDEGRVVELGYTWTVLSLGAEIPGSPREGSGKGDVVAGLQVEDCENMEVVFSATDDLGNVGYGSAYIAGHRCSPRERRADTTGSRPGTRAPAAGRARRIAPPAAAARRARPAR